MTPVRVGVCSLVAFSVLAHGAVETWSAFILEIGAASLFLLWGILTLRERRVEIRWNWLYLPLLTLVGFALLQSLAGLSVYPYVTKVELLKAGAYLLLFFPYGRIIPDAGRLEVVCLVHGDSRILCVASRHRPVFHF